MREPQRSSKTTTKLCKRYCVDLNVSQSGNHLQLSKRIVWKIAELLEAEELAMGKLDKFSSDLIRGKSPVTTEYGKLFNGVDKFDALLANMGKQPRKEGWCKILMFHLMRIVIANSFVIFENIVSQPTSMKPNKFSDAIYKFLLRL